jgi:TnpA family transposase
MPRRRVLTEAQLETLFALPTTEADLALHWTLSPADHAAIQGRRGDHNRLGFTLQLCALRYPGRLLRPGETIPHPALNHLASQLNVDPGALAAYAARFQTRYEQLDDLRRLFGFTTPERSQWRELLDWMLPVALATTRTPAIAAALMDEIRRRQFIAPGPSVIERMVATAVLMAERRVASQLAGGLPVTQAGALDALLQTKEGTSTTTLAWARQPAGAPGHRALTRLIDQLACLRGIGLDPELAAGVHPERLRQLAREGGRFTAAHLRALAPLRRRATLVATVLDTRARLTDDGIALFDRAVGRLLRRAEAREEDAVLRNARAINDKVRLFAQLGDALLAAKTAGGDPLEAVETAIGWERLARSVAEARRLVRPDKTDLPALAARAWPVLHRLGPPFLAAFRFRALPAAAGTLRAVEMLRDIYQGDSRTWPRSLPVAFLKSSWRGAVLAGEIADRRTWEVATLLALRDRLRAGDIWVEGSRQWRAIEDQLIAPALFQNMRAAGPLPVAVPDTADSWLEERRTLLARRLTEVAGRAACDALTDVRIEAGALTITPHKTEVPEAAKTFAERLYDMLPSVRITDLLAEVDGWTGVSAQFTHLRSGRMADDPRVVLTAVLADATNLGLTRMAEACDVASYHHLAWTAGWHLREETYRQALAVVVNAHQRQPLATVFGAGTASSSDGQLFLTAGRGEAAGNVNARAGRDPAVSIYTHISDRYVPFYTRLTASHGEAAHVIDGLLYHEADLTTSVHHTDGGGVSDHVFGLAHLLGFRFAPRIPNLAERRLYTFGLADNWPALAPFIAGRIDEALIATYWDELLRLAASVRTGVVSASLMLRRLGAYPRQNGLALALREVGRIQRTLLVLDWLGDPQLRRRATAELNKGEARNALARAVCFHRLGRMRDRGAEAQQHRASGLALVTAAIVLWNTVYLGRALDALRRDGIPVSQAVLAHLAPLGWRHINLTGDYLWTGDSKFDPDGFRALRSRPAALATLAAA